LFGDNDVALLLGLGPVVDRLQRIRPTLAWRAAGAGRVELAAVAKGVGQGRIGLAIDGYRLIDVLARVAIGVEIRFRRRAQRLAALLVVGESLRHGRKRDREITAVAGAHAHRAIGARWRAHVRAAGWRHDAAARIRIVVAEQVAQEIAG